MYEVLGDYYDELLDESYYAKWKDYIARLVGERKNGVDVGCGSGIFTADLCGRGKTVLGVDSSRTMLDRAFERFVKLGLKPKFVLGRAEKLELPAPAEFITAVNDVVNYMKDPTPFFKAAYDSLTYGGVLIFDISSEYKLKTVLAGNTFAPSSECTVCVWENSPVAKGGYIDMNLKFFVRRDDGLFEERCESQRQYIHKTEDIIDRLEQIGFKTRAYGDLTSSKPKEKAQRIHFRAEKVKKGGRK